MTGSIDPPIGHRSPVSDWHAAHEVGQYTTPSRGRALADDGFVGGYRVGAP